MICAICHDDHDDDASDVWSVYFSCGDARLDISKDEFKKHLTYNRKTSSWVLNLSANPELVIFDNTKPTTLVYNCTVGVLPTELAQTVLRTCTRSTVDTCPEDWTDEFVRAKCKEYTEHVCVGDTVYRNVHCEICNNKSSFDGSACYFFDKSIASGENLLDVEIGNRGSTFVLKYSDWIGYRTKRNETEAILPFDTNLPDFQDVLNWSRTTEDIMYQQVTNQQDAFKETNRTELPKAESRCNYSSLN
jgi:hypothetical protein